MANPVLDRLRAERTKHVDYIQQLLGRVDEDQRDLVDAETAALASTKERIAQIDAQIQPLEEFEATRAAHEQTVRDLHQATDTGERSFATTHAGGGQAMRLGVQPRDQVYASAGDFLADLVKSQRHWIDQVEQPGNAEAAERIAAARDTAARKIRAEGYSARAAGDVAAGVHQTTTDVPGLLPVTIQGQVENQLDGSRPLIQSLGAKDLAGIPGLSFNRPHITQHTKIGKQAAEKAELESRELVVAGIPFTKETAGGWLNVSRQAIDWTSPEVWNILLSDLQLEYAEQTDDITAAAFGTGVTQSQSIASGSAGSVDAWIDALYAAAFKAATANGTKRPSVRRLPNVIYSSMDRWRDLGAMLTKAAISANGDKTAGQSDPTGFEGSLLDVPRIMVPGLPAGTVIVGRKDRFEYYEQRIGLLSAIVPKVFGMEIAYGGYYAYGFLDATAFCKITVAGA